MNHNSIQQAYLSNQIIRPSNLFKQVPSRELPLLKGVTIGGKAVRVRSEAIEDRYELNGGRIATGVEMGAEGRAVAGEIRGFRPGDQRIIIKFSPKINTLQIGKIPQVSSRHSLRGDPISLHNPNRALRPLAPVPNSKKILPAQIKVSINFEENNAKKKASLNRALASIFWNDRHLRRPRKQQMQIVRNKHNASPCLKSHIRTYSK